MRRGHLCGRSVINLGDIHIALHLPSFALSRFACSNYVPWVVIGVCYAACPMILIVIRYLLAKENRRRDSEPVDGNYDDVYIAITDGDGMKVARKVEKVCCSAEVAYFG